jgi:hypothetical protein
VLYLLTVSLPLLFLLREEEYHYRPLPPREEVHSMSGASFDITLSKIDTQRLNVCSILLNHRDYLGHAVAQLVEAQHYKPEGRGFDFRWCH